MPTIKIHYFSDDLPRLQKTGKGDWIDLYAAQTMQLRAGDFALIPLGVSMQLPEGYDPETRLVVTAAEAPTSGSYVIGG